MAYSSPMVPDTKMNGTSGASSRASASANMPSKCGMEKSEMISAGLNSRSSVRNAGSVSTSLCVMRRPARFSSRISSSASVGMSSTIRIRSSVSTCALSKDSNECRPAPSAVRRPIDRQPVVASLPREIGKGVEIHRLHHVAVDSELIGLRKVLLFLGGRHHDHRYALRALVRLDRLQHLDPVHARHLQV